MACLNHSILVTTIVAVYLVWFGFDMQTGWYKIIFVIIIHSYYQGTKVGRRRLNNAASVYNSKIIDDDDSSVCTV